MKVLRHEQAVFRTTLAAGPPVRRLRPGDCLEVTVPDCDGMGADGKVLPAERFESYPPPNPAAGPFHLSGAEPGGMLAVTILEVRPDRAFGRSGLGPRQTPIPPAWFARPGEDPSRVDMPAGVIHWDLVEGGRRARLSVGKGRFVELPCHPFPGLLAVAPPENQVADTLGAGDCGGNLDLPCLGVGTTLHLPVFHPGGHFFVGDLHAAQGDGEFAGGAIEVSGTVVLRLDYDRKAFWPWPWFEQERRIGALAAGRDLDAVLKLAAARLALVIERKMGLDRWMALRWIAQAAQARPGNRHTAACWVDRHALHDRSSAGNALQPGETPCT